MAITTIAQLNSGLVTPYRYIKQQTVTPVIGTWYSLWTYGGMPGGGAAPTGNTKGQYYTNTSPQTGQVWIPGAVAGDTLYLATLTAQANFPGTLILADRIWADSLKVRPDSSGNASQTQIYTGSFYRSSGLAGGDSSGRGILLAMECYTTMGATAVTPKATVINDQGQGDTWTCWSTVPTTAVAGTFVPMYSTKHCYGVRSVSVFHGMTTHTSGTWGLTAFRILGRIGCSFGGLEGSMDAISAGFPEVFANTVPFLIWVAGSTSATTIQGRVQWAYG